MSWSFDTGAIADYCQRYRYQATRRVFFIALTALATLIGLAAPVTAEVIQISGAGLVRHCPCDFDAADSAEVTQGVLQPQDAGARYFAPVVFPKSGVQVCRVSMIYRDVNNNDTMTLSLNRKNFSVGGNAFQAPVVMASLESAPGVVDTVRRATTKTVKKATVDTSKAFYYLEVDVPTINLEILGIQILVKNTC